MTIRLKKLSSQVLVITGATSGIGLTTARMAAGKGARLVLAARDSVALDQLVQELRGSGGEALAVPTDVGNRDEVAALGRAAVQRFGRIDSWINNAGISIFGRNADVPLQDQEKLFQTNFWGVVHGSLVALELMKEGGGAIINLGSELSDRAVPLQRMYSASKHAVKGFTDSLRMEIEKDKVPVSVTLIKPAGIDTMFILHARNYMANEPELPAPLYAPELVAEAILFAAENRQRDIFVGGASKMVSLEGQAMPRVLDKFMNMMMFKQQQKKDPPSAPDRSDALYAPNGMELQQRQGGHDSKVHERSAYTYLTTRGKPLALSLLVGGALLAAWSATRPLRSGQRPV
ncbi:MULTISPECIES: SDR family oxidoreductase [unclassified Duganella]|uniref:SDR family oxidoreductase n=1 Tax=unclassified Duganella TaxID=2636909 RepID=UPI00088037C2|nr:MULTISPECIES: SDR family oxidoreductase [unclassified Duganella]SDF75739.1 Short-chain dehydrogenase [Duganella sp. OV458]SDI53822.1 Short-chain dehydrogenase [Duganella sp. OV510]